MENNLEQPGPQSSEEPSTPLRISKKSSSLIKWLIGGVVTFIAVALSVVGAGYLWYKDGLSSPSPQDSTTQRIVVKKGSTIGVIAKQLQDAGLIKSAKAFEIYYRFNGENPLQAGEYSIKRNLGVADIVNELAEGRNREHSITFLPGQNLMDIYNTFRRAGFKDSEIKFAFNNQYSRYGMMRQIPEGGDIEGFVFPDTYSFNENYTVGNILKRPFDYMQDYIIKENLESAYKKHGITLYQGIILASIIQKAENYQTDMGHVSQVFHSRLKKGMPLGSDPTFVYPAKKHKLQPHPDLDSPYNTYKITGLPPGPIANPGKEALYAAAYPSTDTDD